MESKIEYIESEKSIFDKIKNIFLKGYQSLKK